MKIEDGKRSKELYSNKIHVHGGAMLIAFHVCYVYLNS